VLALDVDLWGKLGFKKVAHTYRYYLTRLGRSAIAAAASLTRFNIVPAMAGTL
jgi:hypothetical protein